MKIWCLFSVENMYDQPDHNLVIWWQKKPSVEIILATINGALSDTESVIAAANLLQGKHEARYKDTTYKLQEVIEGEPIPQED